MLVIRATPASRAAAAANIAEDAELSARVYVVELAAGQRELLYGVSVFANREGGELGDILDRFPGAPMHIEAPAGAIRKAGFLVIPTGENPNHFDVQLLPGVGEGQVPPLSDDVRRAVARLLAAAGEMRPNPAYARGADERSEEE